MDYRKTTYVHVTKHFKERFRERQAKTKRIRFFAQKAYVYGTPLSEVDKDKYFSELVDKEVTSQSEAVVYKGFVYWFKGNSAITLYALPNCLRGKKYV